MKFIETINPFLNGDLILLWGRFIPADLLVTELLIDLLTKQDERGNESNGVKDTHDEREHHPSVVDHTIRTPTWFLGSFYPENIFFRAVEDTKDGRLWQRTTEVLKPSARNSSGMAAKAVRELETNLVSGNPPSLQISIKP